MNNQHRKNRITIIIIFALAIVPFLLAWYFARNPEVLKLGQSNGELIRPPLSISSNDYKGYDDFSIENLKELPGHWILINVSSDGHCTQICQDALYKTQQISLMMGKDISRIRRVVIMPNTEQKSVVEEWQKDARLLKIVLANGLPEKLSQIVVAPEGMLMIMDPLGNLMMKYPVGFDPYKVKSDLSKLLKISQIG